MIKLQNIDLWPDLIPFFCSFLIWLFMYLHVYQQTLILQQHKIGILIICHGGHFSFSKLSLSGTNFFTPIDVRFFRFLLCFDFVKLYLEKND